MQCSFQKLDDGSWGVKLNGMPGEAVGKTGQTVTVQKRNGGTSTATLGMCVDKWNAGRSAVYQIAGKQTAKASGKGPIQMSAKYEGKCFECSGTIEVGEAMLYDREAAKGKKCRHASCDDHKRMLAARVAAEEAQEQAHQRKVEQVKAAREAKFEAERAMTQEQRQERIAEIDARLRAHGQNPPTMDYMTEFSRTMAEIGELTAEKKRLSELRKGDRVEDGVVERIVYYADNVRRNQHQATPAAIVAPNLGLGRGDLC
jgi:hypothetical protein